ncbi:hypothetical protein N7492_009988 [Penicillium capsulatum]|uniref:F-box domain-containing protein n=1 Tax=Penicillium capsulatum TaxID=69766 RepID=A0A9W9HMZ7_9EURO|nr:hypothetical protein N7492_009988 [Penicillium capsulatum]KAJ6112497.1 hypothetical protein N7512_007821 [Penicillium capsulatum]
MKDQTLKSKVNPSARMPPSMEALPTELLLCVLDMLDHQETKFHLLQASRTLRRKLMGTVWRKVTLNEPWQLDKLMTAIGECKAIGALIDEVHFSNSQQHSYIWPFDENKYVSRRIEVDYESHLQHEPGCPNTGLVLGYGPTDSVSESGIQCDACEYNTLHENGCTSLALEDDSETENHTQPYSESIPKSREQLFSAIVAPAFKALDPEIMDMWREACLSGESFHWMVEGPSLGGVVFSESPFFVSTSPHESAIARTSSVQEMYLTTEFLVTDHLPFVIAACRSLEVFSMQIKMPKGFRVFERRDIQPSFSMANIRNALLAHVSTLRVLRVNETGDNRDWESWIYKNVIFGSLVDFTRLEEIRAQFRHLVGVNSLSSPSAKMCDLLPSGLQKLTLTRVLIEDTEYLTETIYEILACREMRFPSLQSITVEMMKIRHVFEDNESWGYHISDPCQCLSNMFSPVRRACKEVGIIFLAKNLDFDFENTYWEEYPHVA